jgi:hypothetical protein
VPTPKCSRGSMQSPGPGIQNGCFEITTLGTAGEDSQDNSSD